MKYEFTNETIMHNGRKLFRIRALKSFNGVEVGELGGFIEKEENLNHSGDAWVCGDAWVYGDAQVFGDALVFGDARVYGSARVYDNARVYSSARVSGNALVCGDALVSKTEDYLTIGPMGSRCGFTTFYMDRTNKIFVACGCFLNSIDNFEETVTTIHAETKHQATYKLAIQLAKAQIVLK